MRLTATARACVGTLSAVALVSATLAAPALADDSTGHHTFAPGSQGIGDPYFPLEGNGGYDAQRYNLALRYDPSTHKLGGTVTMRALATQDLSRFDLDLSGYRVSAVQVDGAAATFTRSGQELQITPARGLVSGHRFTAAVTYAGVPKTVVGSPIVFGAPYGWIYTEDGAFVGCEPNAAHTWFPSSDHPRDKASFRFAITVPTGRQVVANGAYRGHHVSGDSDTYVWAEQQPMATYLATVDIGRWAFHQTTTGRGISEFVAVDPTLAKEATRKDTVGLTSRITDYWAKTFGSYAFGSTGAIVDNVPDIGFSLETQTRPLYGFVPDPVTASHELSHEWFGDSVSVESWKDIWLNEGFATFSEWLWAEHDGGMSTWRQARREFADTPADDTYWKQSIADPQRDGMFSGAVYKRGGLTMAALRHKIGDKAFFRLLRLWVRIHQHGNASTADFRRLAGEVSGQRLGHFFHTWLWRQAKPSHL